MNALPKQTADAVETLVGESVVAMTTAGQTTSLPGPSVAATADDDRVEPDKPPPHIDVLMVDDDGAYRALCSRLLSRDRNVEFRLTGADSAAQALELCVPGRYDCLLIDYRLPDATGTEVLGQLKQRLGDQLPPAIILTALGGEAAATEAVRTGASDFLAKRNASSESLSRALRNAAEKGRLLARNRDKQIELRRVNEELRRRSEEIQRFYHTVAHEVKTPLTAVREFIAIINDEILAPVTAEQHEILGYALESCDQLTGHFDDLVTLTRLEAGKLTIKRVPASLQSVLARCLTAASVPAKHKSIEIVNQMQSSLPNVLIDADRIYQVLANLLNNAIKFTDPGGQVELFSRHDPEAGFLEVSVRDSGPGISDDHLESVFERLYQVNPNVHGDNSGGLGLGLSIAQEIIQRHDSRINVSSTPGVGSTFSFRLQVADEPANCFSSDSSADNDSAGQAKPPAKQEEH